MRWGGRAGLSTTGIQEGYVTVTLPHVTSFLAKTHVPSDNRWSPQTVHGARASKALSVSPIPRAGATLHEIADTVNLAPCKVDPQQAYLSYSAKTVTRTAYWPSLYGRHQGISTKGASASSSTLPKRANIQWWLEMVTEWKLCAGLVARYFQSSP